MWQIDEGKVRVLTWGGLVNTSNKGLNSSLITDIVIYN